MTGFPFAVRGVIEGFYGQPWTHTQRLDMITFMARHRMNTFVYAPKDDPFIRREWREKHDDASSARLEELVGACAKAGLRFVYCLSPGLSIEYSSADDVDSLVTKFAALGALGVRDFGLLLDDIPAQLQHPADRARFRSLVDAHIHLVGSVFARLPRGTRLIVCPTQYWGYGDEEYISTLGQQIDPRIDLFWTGRLICSPTLDLWDAATFARATGRKATFWDNYPVNDVAMGGELHVGPYLGRDPHLFRFADGVIANAMDLFESSKIALATIGDYLVDPVGYDPEDSWERAILEVAGPADAEAYALFADNCRSSCLSPADAPLLEAALNSFAFGSEFGDAEQAASDLADLAAAYLAAAEHLLTGPVHNPALIDEARPWLEAFRIGAHAIAVIAGNASRGEGASTAGASTAGAGTASDATRATRGGEATDDEAPSSASILRTALAELRGTGLRIFGDVLTMALRDLTEDYTSTDITTGPTNQQRPTAKE